MDESQKERNRYWFCGMDFESFSLWAKCMYYWHLALRNDTTVGKHLWTADRRGAMQNTSWIFSKSAEWSFIVWVTDPTDKLVWTVSTSVSHQHVCTKYHQRYCMYQAQRWVFHSVRWFSKTKTKIVSLHSLQFRFSRYHWKTGFLSLSLAFWRSFFFNFCYWGIMSTKCAHTFLMSPVISYLTAIQSIWTPPKLKNHVKGQAQNSDTGGPKCCKSPVMFACQTHMAEG